MDIVQNFKSYLQSQKNPPSTITVKNYLSDVRRFLNWYKQLFYEEFTPEAFSSKVVAQYQIAIQNADKTSLPAAKSAKRYISSLRKFASFLEETNEIIINPFSVQERTQTNPDPLYLKAFRNFLSLEQASKLTIKNYLVDVKQFLEWLEKVTNISAQTDASNLLAHIDTKTLEEYKIRLYTEAKLSPVSINRKLSSLRRYTKWLNEKDILDIKIDKNMPNDINATKESEGKIQQITKEEKIKPIIPELPVTALQGIAEKNAAEKKATYSPFAPIRLAQKTTKLISLCSDLLIFNPIASIAETIHYSLWKKGKRKIFTPVSTILESSSYIPQGVSIKTIIPKETSIQAPRTANLVPVAKKVLQYGAIKNPETVRNFTKALYAPLQLSTKQMTRRQKMLHHLRYSRPQWYKHYHSFAFVNQLHYAIMMIATVIAGAALFQAWTGPANSQTQAVLAAQETASPRTLQIQGRLLDKTNTPITTDSSLRFSLYNSPTATGAALLWVENQDIKPDHNGYFTATLGKTERLDQSLFTDNANLYLGISVNGHQELMPRQQIPTANYAADSQTVNGLKPITDNPDITQNVLLALDSAGNLTIGGTESHTFQATGGQLSVSGQTLLLTTNPSSNGNVKISPDGSGIIDLQKPIQNTSNYSTSGGIPGAVEVQDILSVLATSSSHSALVINQNGTGDIISGQSNGIDKFSLDNQGNAFFAGDIITDSDTIGTTSNTFDIGGPSVQNLTLGTNASVVALGGIAGVTSINNSISIYGPNVKDGPLVNVLGNLQASGGITVPEGENLTLKNFTPGAIPFINTNNQVVQDANTFSWDDGSGNGGQLTIAGSICITNAGEACDTNPNIASHSGSLLVQGSVITRPGDLAENYVSSQNLQPGDLVVPEGLSNNMAIIKSTKPYQQQLIGIISTNPGVTLNSGAKTDPEHPNVYPLALQGRVPVKVSTINGPIQAGDDLTSSSIPGVAMEASGSGQIIGKALESYNNADPNAVGKIMAFVNLSYRTNPATIADNGNLAAATESGMLQIAPTPTATPSALASILNATANTINSAAIQAQQITTQTLNVATDTITIDGKPLKDYIATLVQQMNANNSKTGTATHDSTNQTATPSASSAATMSDQTASPSASSVLAASNSATPRQDISKPASGSATQKTSLSIYNSIATASAKASPSATPAPTISLTLPQLPDASSSGLTNFPNSQTTGNLLDRGSIGSTQYESVTNLNKQATNIPNLSSDYATFNQGLIALGPTSLTDVAVSDMLTINNNLKLTSDAIDTIGSNLNIESLRQGNINFMGGLVAIDTQGNLNVNGNAHFSHNVTVHGQLAAGVIAPIPNQDLIIHLKSKKIQSSFVITNASGSGVMKVNQSGDIKSSGAAQFNAVASNGFSVIRGAEADTSVTQTRSDSSAGKGIISAYETERTIFTPYVKRNSLIYITATSNTGEVIPYLARQTVEAPTKGTRGSFTVEIPFSIAKNVTFNWWIVN